MPLIASMNACQRQHWLVVIFINCNGQMGIWGEYFTKCFVGGPAYDEKMEPTGSKVLEK